jgi:streptogrisin C
MHRRIAGLATLGIATVTLVAAVTIPAGAASAPASDTASPAASADMFAALQRDLRLTPEQARARLASEERAARTDAQLRAVLGPRFAGSWLNADTLVVAVTDAAAAAQVRTAGAQAKVVSRGAAQLDRLKAKLDRAGAKASRAVSGWYVDEASNTVVITAQTAAAGKAFATTGGLRAGDVRVVKSAEAPRTLFDVRGADAFYIGGGRCSIGFSVAGGYVTAGHCGTTGTATSGFNRIAQGTFGGSSFPGNDYAWVRTNADWTPTAFVNDYLGNNVPVAGGQEAAVGAAICRSGSTTGWHCGVVQAKNVSVNYAQGQVDGLTRTNVCAEPGDSGGSWISGDQAQGTTSGGSGNCTSGGTTYFQPLTEALSAFGLTLTTTGTSSTTPPVNTPTNAPAGAAWQAGIAYAIGNQVTYNGIRYAVRTAHISQVGWEPPNVPALFSQL